MKTTAKIRTNLFALALALTLAPWAQASEDHDHGHEEEGAEKTSTILTPAATKAADVGTEVAGAGEINETVALHGKLALDPRASAKVSARYPGTVKRVHVNVGDAVKAGQTLLTIESNISLSNYTVTAPLAGTVVEVATSAGQQTADTALVTVANTAKLRATLQAFAKDAPHLKVGQNVQLTNLQGTVLAEGKLQQLVPDATSVVPILLTTLDVSNTGTLVPGTAVLGKVTVAQKQAPLTVLNTGLQSLREATVVFVKEGETYEAHPLTLGTTDGTRTEVLSGLEPGTTYVTRNSYTIKADIEKSGASHEH